MYAQTHYKRNYKPIQSNSNEHTPYIITQSSIRYTYQRNDATSNVMMSHELARWRSATGGIRRGQRRRALSDASDLPEVLSLIESHAQPHETPSR